MLLLLFEQFWGKNACKKRKIVQMFHFYLDGDFFRDKQDLMRMWKEQKKRV